jgi:acetamidase/formamidase
MLHLTFEPLCYEFSRHNPPRAFVDPGETLLVESQDAFSGQIRHPTDLRDKSKVPFSNPVTGPIAVRGARPGDALAVTIHQIEPLIAQCATYTGGARQLGEWLGEGCPPGTRICPIRDGQIRWSPEIEIPYAPMLGCMGTAPAWGSPSTYQAGNHGGNMDLVEVSPGNTVLLPVEVEGGLLYLGDAHAAQGQGELSANGLEMPAASRITVELREGLRLPGPRVESPQWIMAVAAGTPLERSIACAYARLILWLECEFDWNRWEAYDLLTHVGELSIGHHAVGAVGAKVNRAYLA